MPVCEKNQMVDMALFYFFFIFQEYSLRENVPSDALPECSAHCAVIRKTLFI